MWFDFYLFIWLKHIKKRLPLLLQVSFWANRYQEFNIGHAVAGSFFFIINFLTFLKVFEVQVWIYPIVIPFFVLLVWVNGRILKKIGFWKYFLNAQFKDTNIEK